MTQDNQQFEKIPSEDALTQEASILKHFEDLGDKKNPKKVKKLATRLYGQSPHTVQKKLCRDILMAADPVGYVERCIAMINDCSTIVQQFVEDGCHGMIMMGNDVYPVKLKTLAKWLEENKRWDPEEEAKIQKDAAQEWLNAYEKDWFFGKVVLFPNFGFSGVPRIIEIYR